MIIFGGFNRLRSNTPRINGLPVLIVSVIATVFMAISTFILGKDALKKTCICTRYVDMKSDDIASAAVAIGSGVIYFTGCITGLTKFLQY